MPMPNAAAGGRLFLAQQPGALELSGVALLSTQSEARIGCTRDWN